MEKASCRRFFSTMMRESKQAAAEQVLFEQQWDLFWRQGLKNLKPEQILAIGLYWPLAGEVDVRFLTKILDSQGIKFLFPKALDFEKRRMAYFEAKLPLRLQTPSQNVRKLNWELETYPTPELADLYLVPALAYTSSGYRLGRGQGFFDVYQAQVRQAGHKALFVGVAWPEQIVSSSRRQHQLDQADQPSWEPEPWDQKVDVLLSTNGFWPC